ncbi:putative F-box domain-containing protein [Helianthus anomalus]
MLSREMNKLPTLSVLPEGCLSEILSLTSPRDVCSAVGITKAFKSAADSDPVWERFLPPDYREVIARAAALVVFGSKKQLYRHLSEPYILLDRGYLVNQSTLQYVTLFP